MRWSLLALVLLAGCTASKSDPGRECERLADHLEALAAHDARELIAEEHDVEGTRAKLEQELGPERVAEMWPSFEANFARMEAEKLAMVAAEMAALRPRVIEHCARATRDQPSRRATLGCLLEADASGSLRDCPDYEALLPSGIQGR